MASPNRNEPQEQNPRRSISRKRQRPVRTPVSSPLVVAFLAELGRIDRLFNLFSDSTNVIDAEGIVRLCASLEMERTDVKILLLAWRMNAEKRGCFTRDEWRRGLRKLKADNMEKLKAALPVFEFETKTGPNFQDFYIYSFNYYLTEERPRSLDLDNACELLKIVMGPLFRPQIQLLIEFLRVQTEYRGLVMDQWMGIFRFCHEINFPDLDNYDPTHSWPAILDSFVEWLNTEECDCDDAVVPNLDN